MKNLFTTFALFAVLTAFAKAQSIDTLYLNANDPSIIESEPTQAGVTYTITITGTYSMWPSYDGYGLDAAYLYDVPQEEINALRWPPQEIFSQKIYELPYWVGTEQEFPPIEIPGLKSKFVSREHMGFRYNGNWLPDAGYDAVSHSYKIEIVGDGNPIQFQILDSAYDLGVGSVIPRYEDNSGQLMITIESEPEIEICDVEFICEDGQVVGVKLSAALFEYVDENGKRINALKEGGESRIGISMSGEFISPDSIICDTRLDGTFSWGMVFDASGSMWDGYGNSLKITALKNSASKFIDGFMPQDEAMLIAFNENARLESDWTSDFDALKQIINELDPVGNTVYYDAGIMGVEKTFIRNNPYKALILLSDGEDNSSMNSIMDLVGFAQDRNINIYTIGVSLIADVAQSMEYIAKQTGGKYYTANDPAAMDSVFAAIQKEVTTDECCTIYFSIPQSILAGERPRYEDITIVGFNQDNEVIVKDERILLPRNCDDLVASVQESDNEYAENILGVDVTIHPNPATYEMNIELESRELRTIKLDLITNNGQTIKLAPIQVMNSGSKTFNYSTDNLPSGSYILRVGIDGRYQAFENIIIIK
jgi:hypothetical protein